MRRCRWPYGTDITPDKVRFVDYPNSSIPPGAFTNAAQLLPAGKKRIALMPIGVNEPILAARSPASAQGASIAALLPDGHARRERAHQRRVGRRRLRPAE